MGLIKAALGSAGGVMADQWKEFFTCDSMLISSQMVLLLPLRKVSVC